MELWSSILDRNYWGAGKIYVMFKNLRGTWVVGQQPTA